MLNKTLPVLIIVITSLLAFESCSVRRSEPIAGPLDTTSASINQGALLFDHHCQKCHPAGEGGLGPGLNAIPFSFLKRMQIKHGHGAMPSFKDHLTKEQINNIVSYMKALRKNNAEAKNDG